MGIHKTASGFRSEGLEKRQLLPALKEKRFSAKREYFRGERSKESLLVLQLLK